MMLNLYIYGYLHRVRPSRRLRDEARRNVEAMRLPGGLSPDDKTICNFRKDNGEPLRQTFRKLGLYGEGLVAVDGTKFRANNSLKKHYNRAVVDNELSRIEEKINGYLKARVGKEGEISAADPDARLMRGAGDARPIDVGYNVQTVVDGKYHMIADFEVTNCSSDGGMLHEMTEKAKGILEVEELTALADKGCYGSEDIAACEGSGVSCLMAKKKAGGDVKAKEFAREGFTYGREKDIYVCPCGNEMGYKGTSKKNGVKTTAGTPITGRAETVQGKGNARSAAIGRYGGCRPRTFST